MVYMEYILHARVLFLQLEEATEPLEIAFPVAFLASEDVAYDLVVPEIHVKGEPRKKMCPQPLNRTR